MNVKKVDKSKPSKTEIAQFIYLADGTLICYQLNNNIYLSEKQQNLLFDMNSFNVQNIQSGKSGQSSGVTLPALISLPFMFFPPLGLTNFNLIY